MIAKIFAQEDFISHQYCDAIISLFDELSQVEHRDTEVFEITHLYHENQMIRNLISMITGFTQTCFNDNRIYPNYSQIVRWNKNGQKPHYDFPHHFCTSIIYLNDDFEGGETVVGSNLIKPVKGKIVCFNGRDCLHSVLDQSGESRYTFITWHCNSNEWRPL